MIKRYEFDKYLRMKNKKTKFDQFSPKISKILKRYELKSCFSNEERNLTKSFSQKISKILKRYEFDKYLRVVLRMRK